MGRRFAELAFTPLVKEQQTKRGSRHLYERVEKSPVLGDTLGPHEQAFISAHRTRDGGDRWYGLALSGGGIRSSIFCLGALQALADLKEVARKNRAQFRQLRSTKTALDIAQ